MDSEFLRILYTTLKDLSFWTGFVTVFAFAMGRFDEKQHDQMELDPPFPNRCFTSRFRYLSTALIYALIYLCLYSILVIAGSIPYLQGLLTQLFGSVDTETQIGTPAWAAMVVMVIAPTIARIKKADSRLRGWLLRFASIPYKARQLAEEIILAIRQNPKDCSSEITTVEAIALYQELLKLSKKLTGHGGGRTNESYNEFFSTYDPIITTVYDRFETVKGEYESFCQNGGAEKAAQHASFHRQFVGLLRRHARIIACAVLQSEADEYHAREALRNRGGYTALESASFRFGKSQAVLGVFLVIVSCVILGPLITWVGRDLTPTEMVTEAGKWLLWGIASSFAFLFPVVLAAAVQLWLLDEDEEQISRDWTSHAAILLVTGVGCFALAAIPLFFGAVVDAAIDGRPYNPLLAAYALTPALVAVAFIPASRSRTGVTVRMNALIDFVTFAFIGALSTFSVGAVLSLLRVAAEGRDTSEWMADLVAIFPAQVAVSALICGAFGALQCATSRRYVERVKRRPYRFELFTGKLIPQTT